MPDIVTPRELARIKVTVDALPPSIASVLEIGFSDGRMTRALSERIKRCVALDIPRPIRDGSSSGRVFGTIEMLPFADQAFDAVVCCEVLEHLDQQVFERGVKELQRVARQTVLITVPFEQRLQNERARCPQCGDVSHPHGHVRSFGSDDVRGLLESRHWSAETVAPFGPKIRGYAPDWAYAVRRRAGVYSRARRRCYRCGVISEGTQLSLAGKIVAKLVSLAEPERARYPWILGVWRRTAPGSPSAE